MKAPLFNYLVLDLDDTIYHEVDFVKSGINFLVDLYAEKKDFKVLSQKVFECWQKGENPIQFLFTSLNIDNPPISEAIEFYRTHLPNISLSSQTLQFFKNIDNFKIDLGLLTDGRSVTQRNKLLSLGLSNKFNKIIISEEFGSEKPDIRNFKVFENDYPDSIFCYIGDNTFKDFNSPNKLGWITYCLKSKGTNIHIQNFSSLPSKTKIIGELNDIFEN